MEEFRRLSVDLRMREGACQLCSSPERLEVAHLISCTELASFHWPKFNSIAATFVLDERNLRVLCQKCHSKFDRVVGATRCGRRRPDAAPFQELIETRRRLFDEIYTRTKALVQ